ncbi:retrovirus-related Pol polyprotein from transposon 297 [Trichonephila clavipes]|nr:retrovirus-related Pol polyprotein from transposon 297 [Trichonephila clavipes]
MKDNVVFESSSSPWASPIVLVKKEDRSTRFCVDYRRLNDTIKDSYPLPRIDDTLDTLTGNTWFSTLDLKSGKELLAIVKAVEPFHLYLYGRRFLLQRDYASLTWLLNFKNSEGQIARWIQRLQEYDVEIRHRKGSAHGNADALLRRPCPESCKYCSRIEKKFDVIVRQVTTPPSTSPLALLSDESVQKDQLADPEIKPILEFKESSDQKPCWQDIAPFPPTTKDGILSI